MSKILNFSDCECETLSRLTDKLYDTLTHLRYENRLLREKNLKNIGEALKGLEAVLKRHEKIQETIVFPFLLTHVPRHKTVIHFLKSEHEDIKKTEEGFKANVRRLSQKKEGAGTGKVYECGIRLVAFLKQHMSLEHRSIHESIRKELHEDEKKVIAYRISKGLKKGKAKSP